jgi:hypothetical protein
MNFFDAMKILDQTRENVSYNLYTINKALELTGDLDGFQPSIRATSRASSQDGFAKGLDCLCETKSAGVGS